MCHHHSYKEKKWHADSGVQMNFIMEHTIFEFRKDSIPLVSRITIQCEARQLGLYFNPFQINGVMIEIQEGSSKL